MYPERGTKVVFLKRLDYLYMFRRCSSLESVEKLFEHKRNMDVPLGEYLEFVGAYDHRKAELIHQKLWDRVPAAAWKYVR